MVDLNDQGLRRQNALNDITETTGLVFLGLTIGCARCHDHKFDPIRQADFYRLQAFFTPARFRDDYPIASAAERAALRAARRRPGKARSPRSQAAILRLETPVRDGARARAAAGADRRGGRRVPASPRRSGRPTEVRLVYEAAGQGRPRSSPTDWPRLLDGPRRRAARRCRPGSSTAAEGGPAAPAPGPGHRRDRARRRRRPTSCSAATSRPGGPRSRPAFPAVLAPEAVAPTIEPDRASRPAAARPWPTGSTRPDHPLTARVMVNRLWQHHFGRGIVATPSDFGTMGDEPTPPRAARLAGDRVRRAGLEPQGDAPADGHQRRPIASRRRPTRRPRTPTPRTRCSGGTTRRRLDGEAIRDALLAVSGPAEPGAGRPRRLPRAARRADQAEQQGRDLARLRRRPRTATAAASTSSSGATSATPSSRRSTAPTPTRAARAGRSPRSPPRP